MPYYSLEFANLWFGIKEPAFRTNANGKDTANLATDSFRRCPIKFDGAIKPRPLRYTIEKRRLVGKGLDWGNINRNGYEECKVSITGDLLDFSFLYQLAGLCTTAGSYTHTANIYQSAHASYSAPAAPTFQMLQKVENATGAEGKYLLYCGCKITSFDLSYTEDNARVLATIEIEVGNVIAGLALTTEPAIITDVPYYFNPFNGFVWTGYTGPHTYVGYCVAWKLHYKNGQYLRKANYMTLPDKVLHDYRELELEWTWASEELDDFDDSQRDPTSDLDQDIVHTITNGTDTIVMSWVKAVVEYLDEDYDWKNFYLGRKYKAYLNPAQTSYLGIVETNSADNTYYEG